MTDELDAALHRLLNRDRRGATHCPHGHLYDAENTYINSKGAKECKTCYRARMRGYRAQVAMRLIRAERPKHPMGGCNGQRGGWCRHETPKVPRVRR